MKKVFFCLIIAICILLITACDSSKATVNDLFNLLKEEQIIDESSELVDKVVKTNAGIIPSITSYYVYKTENSELVAVNYDMNIHSKNDYDYLISVYFTVSVNEDIEYVDDTSSLENFYSYSNGKSSIRSKYNFESKVNYSVYESNPLFSKKTKYKIL